MHERDGVFPAKKIIFQSLLSNKISNVSILKACTNDNLTHYQTTNLRLFQTESVCRRNFQFDENGRKPYKRVENTVGKGEIARYEQFLLFPQCFQKASFRGAAKGVIVWEWVKHFRNNQIFL